MYNTRLYIYEYCAVCVTFLLLMSVCIVVWFDSFQQKLIDHCKKCFLLKQGVSRPSLSGVHVCHFCPQIIGGYATFLYQIGLLDEEQQKHFHKQCSKCIQYIKEQDWIKAFEVSSGAPRLPLSN